MDVSRKQSNKFKQRTKVRLEYIFHLICVISLSFHCRNPKAKTLWLEHIKEPRLTHGNVFNWETFQISNYYSLREESYSPETEFPLLSFPPPPPFSPLPSPQNYSQAILFQVKFNNFNLTLSPRVFSFFFFFGPQEFLSLVTLYKTFSSISSQAIFPSSHQFPFSLLSFFPSSNAITFLLKTTP